MRNAANSVPDMTALREWRERLPLSQERVAAKLGISARTIGRWERGYDPGELQRRKLVSLYTTAEADADGWAA